MLAYGAKCSIGDQLHPDGEMNLDTYKLIGAAYAEVEQKEPWCDYVKPVAKIAIVSSLQNQGVWAWRPRGRPSSPTKAPDACCSNCINLSSFSTNTLLGPVSIC